MAEKIFNRSIPMLDNVSPTGAKKVIVSSAENHHFASCGDAKSGFDLSLKRLKKIDTRCNGLAANSAKVDKRTDSLK